MGWRDSILGEFVRDICQLTLVSDPDGLLTEERLVTALREKGFDIIEYEDAISFRFAYETHYRSLWDRGETTDLVVVLRTPESDLENVPYDLYTKGRKLSFSIRKLFPNLSSPVLEELDKKYYDDLFESQTSNPPQRSGDNATRDYILYTVFGINSSSITTIPRLLNLLLRIHYTGLILPTSYNTRIITALRRNPIFREWPLEKLFSAKEAFYEFLQERWPFFIESFRSSQDQVSDIVSYEKAEYGMKYPGPSNLPFDDSDVKIYIDDLFLEGKLYPVSCPDSEHLKNTWIRFGIKDDTQEDFFSRIEKRLYKLGSIIPTSDDDHSRWLAFASDYASIKSLFYSKARGDFKVTEALRNRFIDISEKLHSAFGEWLFKRYNGLMNLPPTPPVVVHQIPRYLERQYKELQSGKIALIVIDGMSLNQWLTMKNVLERQNPQLTFHEQGIFAWIPTLTSVSRQAIFSGKIPLYLSDNINTTSMEPKLWGNYWENAGIGARFISYRKNLLKEDIGVFLESEFNPHAITVAGFVINTIDDIMHGMQLGEEGMHNQIEQWTQNGYLNEMITFLLDNNYAIWITSDHGNIESTGIGNPSEGSISEVKGERVRVFKDTTLRSDVARKYPSAIEWNIPGLPMNYFPLFASGSTSFTRINTKSITHGGLSIDETIVPFVSVSRRDNR